MIYTACCYYSNVVQTLHYNDDDVYSICVEVYKGTYSNFTFTTYFIRTNTTICDTQCDTSKECIVPNTSTFVTGCTGK